MSWMLTFRGRRLVLVDPVPEDFDIYSIAHSLAMQCRFNGHCLRFYSVAEHCVHIWREAPEQYKLEALMHDAPEFAIGDIPRAMKDFFVGPKFLEHYYYSIIAERFGLGPIPAAVKTLDNRILLDERAQNMPLYRHGAMIPTKDEEAARPVPAGYEMSNEERDGWPNVEPLYITLQFWSPERAEREFLNAFYASWKDRFGHKPIPA